MADVLTADGNTLAVDGKNITLLPGQSGTATYYVTESNDLITGDKTGCGVGPQSKSEHVTVSVTADKPLTIASAGKVVIEDCYAKDKTPNNARSISYTVPATATPGSTIEVTGTPSGGKPDHKVAASGGSNKFTITVGTPAPVDSTPPTITPQVTGTKTIASSDWYTSDVAVSFAVVDNESTVSSKTAGCDAGLSVTSDTSGTSVTCSATSAGGTASKTINIKRDTTKPSITAARAAGSEANSNGWNNAAVTVGFSCTDGGSGLAEGACPSNVTKDREGRNQEAEGSVSDLAGNSASDTLSEINIDTTKPDAPRLSVAAGQAPAAVVGDVDWFKDSVNIDVTAQGDPAISDGVDGSGVASSESTAFAYTTNGSTTASGRVSDRAGNTSSAGQLDVNVDAQGPSVSMTSCATSVLVGHTGSAVWAASDGESGISGDTSGTLSLPATTLGSASESGTISDRVGHQATGTCTYNRVFRVDGFYKPIDMAGSGIVNSAKAGSAIPVKASVDGTPNPASPNNGIGSMSSPLKSATSQEILCGTETALSTDTPLDTSGTSGLKFDAAADQWSYVWKSSSTWAGKCRRLTVTFANGVPVSADFKFTK